MIRPPIKWHGGKHYLAKRIIPHFPAHRIYLEPFGGAASVLLNKPPVEVEAYNDIDRRITRLFRTLRDHRDWFIEKARLTLYSEIEFQDAGEQQGDFAAEDDREAAFVDFVRWRQSFGGQGKSFSCTTGRARGGMAGDVNAWWTAIEGLAHVVERIKRVEILNQLAIEVMPKFDKPDALFYLDPTYLPDTRVAKKVYAHEMTEQDHCDLAKYLNTKCRAKVVLSGYPSDLYRELYPAGHWRRVDFDIANHSAGGGEKRRMTECIWMNYGSEAA